MALSGIALLERHLWGDTSELFWDLPVYVATMEAQARRLDPYARETLELLGIPPFLFVNTPPVATWVLGLPVGTPIQSHFGTLLAVCSIVAVVSIPLILGRIFFGSEVALRVLACGAFLTMFAAAGITSISAANLGTVLHALVIAALWPGAMHDRWRSFFAAVAISAIFKPFYLAYLIVPAAANGWSWSRFGKGVGLTTIVALVYTASAVFLPEAFSGWLENLRGALLVKGDAGNNIFAARAVREFRDWRYALQMLVAVAFVVLAVTTRGDARRCAALIVAVQFVNPRMMVYDVAVAAVPLAFLAAELMPGRIQRAGRLAFSVAILCVLQFTAYGGRVVDSALIFPLGSLAIVALVKWKEATAMQSGTS